MLKNSFYIALFIATTALPLTACSSSKAKSTLGMGRQSPDEFAVVERAPLTLPPSYDLAAPRPGMPRPQEVSTTDQARALITGDTAVQTSGEASNIETLLIQQAGGTQANPNIRQVLNQEYGVIPEGSKSERTVDKLNPFKTDNTDGKVIDPTEEAKDLIEKGVKTPQPVISVPETK